MDPNIVRRHRVAKIINASPCVSRYVKETGCSSVLETGKHKITLTECIVLLQSELQWQHGEPQSHAVYSQLQMVKCEYCKNAFAQNSNKSTSTNICVVIMVFLPFVKKTHLAHIGQNFPLQTVGSTFLKLDLCL